MNFVLTIIVVFGAVLAGESQSLVDETSQSNHSTPTPVTQASDSIHHEPTIVTKSSMKSSSEVTTLAPVNPPSNEKGHWNVTDKNITCILISGFINLYNVTVHSAHEMDTFNFSIPPHVPTKGNCKNGQIRFMLDNKYNQTLQFQFDKVKEDYVLNRVDGQLLIPNKGNETVGFMGTNLREFETKVGQSFLCNTFMKFNFTDSKKDKNITVFIELKDFQLQAFKNTTNNGDFGEAYDGCAADHITPDIVPIVVGCALAILVIVVLVAYLISRRRSQARGYLSM